MKIALRARLISGVISTDDIIPGRYKHTYVNPDDMAPHLFEHRFPNLADSFKQGDVLVNDLIMGIGSSREQAVTALKAVGIKAIFAPNFGRIFFRNCWNLGIPAIEIDTEIIKESELITLDLRNGTILLENGSINFLPPSQFMLNMINNDGLINSIYSEGELSDG